MDKSKEPSFMARVMEIPEWDTWTVKSKVKAIYAVLSFIALIALAMAHVVFVFPCVINTLIALKVVKTIPNIDDYDN